jgi:hypothetical protein
MQTVQTFGGTWSYTGSDGSTFTGTIAGTVTGAGQVSGTWTVNGSTGTTGTLAFGGFLIGKTRNGTARGQLRIDGGPITCNFTVSFTGTRP